MKTWEGVSRVYTARLLKQLPKAERRKELQKIRIWRKYSSAIAGW